jgi:multicomponent Na+:H+ antiporter subunit E
VVLAAGWLAWGQERGDSGTVSVTGLLRVIPFFLWESLRGEIDVALRTLAPKMRVQPGFKEFRTGLRRGDARVFLVNCVSLLPGTLATDLQGGRLNIHLLDVVMDGR